MKALLYRWGSEKLAFFSQDLRTATITMQNTHGFVLHEESNKTFSSLLVFLASYRVLAHSIWQTQAILLCSVMVWGFKSSFRPVYSLALERLSKSCFLSRLIIFIDLNPDVFSFLLSFKRLTGFGACFLSGSVQRHQATAIGRLRL